MSTRLESGFFTRREAALLADVSLKSVDKAIEEKIVKAKRGKTTLLKQDDVVVIALIGKVGLPLQRKTKKQIRRWVHEARPHISDGVEELPISNLLFLRPDEHLRQMAVLLRRYGENRNRFIESKPDVMGGDPVIVGTRLPVRAVAERIERGDSIGELREDYPHIPQEAFEAALIYARSHPRRGRPARPWLAA